MPYTPKRLYMGQPAFTGTTLYTASGTTTTILKAITITNTTSTSATFTINTVPSGSSATFSNQIVSALPLSGNATVTFENIGMLNNGDFLYATQGTTGSISIHAYGVEVTP